MLAHVIALGCRVQHERTLSERGRRRVRDELSSIELLVAEADDRRLASVVLAQHCSRQTLAVDGLEGRQQAVRCVVVARVRCAARGIDSFLLRKMRQLREVPDDDDPPR